MGVRLEEGEEQRIRAGRPFGGLARVFDIVKREHGRFGDLISATPAAGVVPAVRPVMFGKRNVFGEIRRRVFLIVVTGVTSSRILIMRAIKCLKSIRWMPWR